MFTLHHANRLNISCNQTQNLGWQKLFLLEYLFPMEILMEFNYVISQTLN